MSTSYAILISLGACGIAAALEGVCAGPNVKAYFARLKSPAYSPLLWVWFIIGGLYWLETDSLALNSLRVKFKKRGSGEIALTCAESAHPRSNRL